MIVGKLDNELPLLSKISEGDEKAFTDLFMFYAPPLAEYVLSILGSKESAEDVIQGVFTKVWCNRANINSIKNFKSYLFIITRNATIDELKRIASEIKNKQDYYNWETSSNYTDEYETSDYGPLLKEAIQNLPPKQQEVFTLSRIEGLKYEAISSRVKINHSTVKRYIYLATLSIAKYMKHHMKVAPILIFLLRNNF